MSSVFLDNSNRYTVLCPGAETCIQAMHLPPSKQVIIRDCVSRYALPDTFSGFLNWLVFRITNAFFYALVGKSVWQAAKTVIYDHAHHMAGAEIVSLRARDFPPGTDQLRQSIELRVECLVKRAVDKLLEACLYAQNRPGISMNQVVQEIDLENALRDQIGTMVDEAYTAGMEGLAQAREAYARSRSST